jgi:hypothetical protein
MITEAHQYEAWTRDTVTLVQRARQYLSSIKCSRHHRGKESSSQPRRQKYTQHGRTSSVKTRTSVNKHRHNRDSVTKNRVKIATRVAILTTNQGDYVELQ